MRLFTWIAILALSALPLASNAANLYDRDSKASWDYLWDVNAESAWGHPNTRQPVHLNYHRSVILPYARSRAKAMVDYWGWDSTSEVVIVFCGFGWIMEALAELGVTHTTCIEPSAYIQSFKLENEDTDIKNAVEAVGLDTKSGDGLSVFTALRHDGSPRALDAGEVTAESLDSKTSRDTISNKFSGNNIHVVTYDGWLQAHDDTEAAAWSDRLHQIQGVRKVSHMVYESEWAPGVQVKTLGEWQALIPKDEFVNF